MIKVCEHCGKEFITDYAGKLYCDKKCAKAARDNRDESFYDYPRETTFPLRTFECAWCGKRVDIYSRYDQRVRFCCGKHAALEKSRRHAQTYGKGRKGSNIGMSGGMSLGSLIRRERMDLD